MEDDYVTEKKAAEIRVRDVEKTDSFSDADGIQREKLISRFKAMNNTGETGDEDIMADKSSHYLYEMFLVTSLDDALDVLKKALVTHYGDVNFPNESYDQIKLLVSGCDAYGTDYDTWEIDTKLEAVVIKYHSPYPEVRAVTDPFDDPDMPVETIRAYILGALWVAVSSFINEFFTFRQPSLSLRSTVVQLFLFPCGKATQLLPDWGFTFRGTRYSINPGPWSIKEQMLATIMINCGGQTSNWMSMTVTLRHKLFYGYEWADFGFVWLMNFASLFFGYGLAGIMRKLCIYPVQAVFPNVLPTLALSRALVVKETRTSVNGWTISRQKLFYVTFVLSFFYFFVPNFLFRALSTFNWMTWIAPKNVTLAMVTGSYIGLGFNPIPTFDWAVINYGNPMVYPFHAYLNKFIGLLLSGFILIGLYWSNYKFSGYMPPNSNSIYDRHGKEYNVSRVVVNNRLDEDLYKAYSPPYMSAGNLVGTGGLWALYSGTFTYILIAEYKLLWDTSKKLYQSFRHPLRKSLQDFDDPQSRLMSRYPEVPDWWYLVVFLIGAGAAFGATCGWPTGVPVWTLIAIFFFNIALLMPILVVLSRTGYGNGAGAFSVILAGYMDPGNAVTNIVIRMWGYNIDEQSESFIGDQKIAHYAKIPQRATFRAQILATLIQCCCTAGAVEALLTSVKNFCSITQVDRFVCAFPRTVYSDAIMFGVIDPNRVLDTVYPALKHAFWIGPAVSIPFALGQLRWPQKMKGFNPSLMGLGSISWGGTYNLTYYVPGMYMSFVFMYYIRRKYTGWWTKYNYILTSGLSAGVAFAGVIIFAALQYTQVTLSWWGNTISSGGVDFARTATAFPIPPEGFGPDIGQFE
ncbi:OPT oligopeptide transporter protein-domain-containing protein [Lipomyces arxii]|uniref:OPT oligopeptide transporter protein-domain-containing protein n=1 Tax=Lipomyces arxii TaxID=56418 RepID=UPI0034CF4C20